MSEIVALVPARAGSKRVVSKNLRPFAGHPLIAYTIVAASQSGIFSRTVVSTDSEEIADIARHYGAEVPFQRPVELAGELSPDIEWVTHALEMLDDGAEYFSILRPTSPFRTAETIRRAWEQLTQRPDADSLRAVERCRQHPGKMWIVRGETMQPLLPFATTTGDPWHSTPYQALPPIWVQNASLEMARSEVVRRDRSISGSKVLAFYTTGVEGIDINDEEDWRYAEEISRRGGALPAIARPPYA